MRKLYYSSGQVLLADVTCKAVLRYARALAMANKSDVVMVPIVLEGGGEGFAHMLIGPASELYSEPVENAPEGPVNEEVLAELETKTVELMPHAPAWNQEMTDVADLRELGLDWL